MGNHLTLVYVMTLVVLLKPAWRMNILFWSQYVHNSSCRKRNIPALGGSMPCLLIPWLLKSPEHQQAWYWLYRTDNMYCCSFHLLGWSKIQDASHNVNISFITLKQFRVKNSRIMRALSGQSRLSQNNGLYPWSWCPYCHHQDNQLQSNNGQRHN